MGLAHMTPEGWGPEGGEEEEAPKGGPQRLGLEGWEGPKFRVFFFSPSPAPIVALFSLSL